MNRGRFIRLLVGTLMVLHAPATRAGIQPLCVGDCDGNLAVSIDEVILGVEIALDRQTLSQCRAIDADDDGQVTLDEPVAAIGNALNHCPRLPPPTTGPEIGALIGGTESYVDGVFVWTDYAYDDRGPNLDALAGGDRTQSEFAGGDVAYPPEAETGNAADLIQLQIRLTEEGNVQIRAVLQTLVDATVPVLGIAFDTDNDAFTGSGTLPGSQWLVEGSLGVDMLVVIAAGGAELQRFIDNRWTVVTDFEARVDPEANLMETTIPLAEADPGRATWRAFAAAGIDVGNGSWVDGGSSIYDLAFVGDELLVRWQENKQADILAGALDASEAAASIDFARLADGVVQLPPLPPGFQTFLYHSTLTLPEGIAIEGDNPVFLGPYQPYAVYIPEGMPRPAPAALFLHGLDQNHLGSVFVSPEQTYLGTGRALSEDPYLLSSFAPDGFDFPPPTLQLYPLARGEGLFYRGIAHQDVLDVIDDAMRRFEIDPNRVSLQGASMGGIGAYRIGSLNPDRWSAVVPLIGFQETELLPLSQNLLNVPVRQINGAMDPLIPQELADASAARLDLLGFDYRYWLAFDRGHEAGGFIYSCVFEQVAELVRNPDPPRILYALDSRLIEVDPESGLDLRFDSVYWTSGITARDSNNLATLDVSSSALPHNQPLLERIKVTVDNFEQGADLCGPNPDVQTEETWQECGVVRIQGDPVPISNALSATLTNLAAITLDLTRAGIETNDPGTIGLSTDGETSITMTGFPAGKEIRVDDASVIAADANGEVTANLSLGLHELRW
jgi:hypothetical protein